MSNVVKWIKFKSGEQLAITCVPHGRATKKVLSFLGTKKNLLGEQPTLNYFELNVYQKPKRIPF